MGRYAVLVLWILLFSASQAQADFYRWVDRDGKEYYSNDLMKVPPEYRDQARSVETRDDRVSVGENPVATGKKPVGIKEHKDKYGRGEEWWRRRAENIRLKLRDLQDKYDLVLKQEQEEEQKPKKLSSKKKSSASLERKKLKLEKELAQVRRQLEVDLPEEARKADAYPGWIRE